MSLGNGECKRKHMEWISIYDKLPELNATVLAWNEAERCVVGWRRNEYSSIGGITHWMEMPCAPYVNPLYVEKGVEMKRCQDCRKWMNHHECKREKYNGAAGRWHGPSMDAFACEDYEPREEYEEESK